jgi:SOS-response transcriptional repressor LexA
VEYPNNLASIRAKARISQKAAAEKVGISQPEYGRMELGRRQIGHHVGKICEVFDVTEDDVFEAPTVADIKKADAVLSDSRLPVFGRPGFGTQLRWTSEAQKMILKPQDFDGSKEAYAVTMPNDSMNPRCRGGDTLYVDPVHIVKDGDLVIVAQKESDLRDIVQLVEKQTDKWTFERFDPAEKLEIDIADLDSVHPVRAIKYV